jgi:hypothetical protein
MEKPIQCVQGPERINPDRVHIFVVCHLSPAASWHLLQLLDQVKPKCVLIEGPSDANDILRYIPTKGVKPPIAILAYTSDLPVDTVLYPLAECSPEYQAVCWAAAKKAELRFIDLPSGVLLSLNKWEKDQEYQEHQGCQGCQGCEGCQEDQEDQEEHEDQEDEEYEDDEDQEVQDIDSAQLDYHDVSRRLHSQAAEMDNAVDFDDYYEKNFEHNLNPDSYYQTMRLESTEFRRLLEPIEAGVMPKSNARDLVRESYMARQIEDAIKDGYKPEEIVVVTGAYHADTLQQTVPMTDEQLL